MKVLLAFARAGGASEAALAPYRSEAFVRALGENGAEVEVVALDGGSDRLETPPSVLKSRDPNAAPSSAASLDAALARFVPDVVHTFGAVGGSCAVWRRVREMSCRLAHFAQRGMGEAATEAAASWWRPQPLAERAERGLSSQVTGLVGSNAAELADERDRGYFPHARLTMLTVPPVEVDQRRSERPRGAVLRVGYHDPFGTERDLQFLLDAHTTFPRPPYAIVLGSRSSARPSAGALPAMVSVHDGDLPTLLDEVDALVFPGSEDRHLPTMLEAIGCGRIVIAPDNGATAELLNFGRYGELFEPRSARSLAMCLRNLADGWPERALRLDPATLVAAASPRRVAERFAAFYRALAIAR